MLIQEEYSISRNAMIEILQQYIHPSPEDARARDQMMMHIRENMSVHNEGSKAVVTYTDLDLSFLNGIFNNSSIEKHNPYEAGFDGHSMKQSNQYVVSTCNAKSLFAA